MTKRLLLLLFVLLTGAGLSTRGALVITYHGSASDKEVPLSAIDKLTFTGGKLSIHKPGGGVDSEPLAQIEELRFNGTSTALDDAQLPQIRLLYERAAAQLTVTGAPDGAMLSIFNPAGTCVLRAAIAHGGSPVSVASLPSGVYMAAIADLQFKFIK